MGHIVADGIAPRSQLAFLGDAEMTAIASVLLAVLLALIVDRALRRAHRAKIVSNLIDPSTDTRLRFLRRVIEVTIVVIGIAIALSQFTALDRLAASVLASGAIAAAIVGFAARQTIANVVAGILLATTQPLRIGDVVTFEGESGTVEDVRLTYTFLRTPAGTRVVIPNERLAGGILRNDTVLGRVTPEVSVWVPATADVEATIAAVEQAVDGARVTVADSAAEGVRLAITAPAVAPSAKLTREAELRRSAILAISATREQPAGDG